MAKRRHGGLGRGLDALIPQKPWKEPEKEEKKTDGIEEAKGSGPEKDSGAERAAASESRDEGSVLSEVPSETASPEAGSVQKSAGGSGESGELGGSGEAASAAVFADSSGSQSESKESSASADDSIRTLRLSQIDPNRSQPRQYFEDESLDELSDSIRQFGVLQPILVQKKGNRYEIIAGERRWRAARLAKLSEVPAIVMEADDKKAMELALIENLQRQDLNAVEEAMGYRGLMDDHGLTQEEAAARVGKSRPAVANALRLLNLDPDVLDMVRSGQLTAGHARAVLVLKEKKKQLEAAKKIISLGMSVRAAETLCKNMAKPEPEKKEEGLKVDYVAECEKSLSKHLGRGVKIVSGKKKGRFELEFYGQEDLQKLLDALMRLK